MKQNMTKMTGNDHPQMAIWDSHIRSHEWILGSHAQVSRVYHHGVKASDASYKRKPHNLGIKTWQWKKLADLKDVKIGNLRLLNRFPWQKTRCSDWQWIIVPEFSSCHPNHPSFDHHDHPSPTRSPDVFHGYIRINPTKNGFPCSLAPVLPSWAIIPIRSAQGTRWWGAGSPAKNKSPGRRWEEIPGRSHPPEREQLRTAVRTAGRNWTNARTKWSFRVFIILFYQVSH